MNTILIKGALIAGGEKEFKGDILLKNGIIHKIAPDIEEKADVTMAINGKAAVMPGLFDMHVHFRDPGFTYKEDILTGCQAALAGGVTGAACMPNTKPAADSAEVIEYILEKAKETGVEVVPVACITKGLMGEELCNFSELKKAGAGAVSDDGRPVKNAELLRQAMTLAEKEGLLTISHCEDMDIIKNGIIHKGTVSEKLGVAGMDRASEDSITAREIAIAACENTRIHIAHVSTAGSVALIRDAKRRGVRVTCETAPHYFTYTHEKLLSRDADYRMNPPLREEEDRQAVLEGLLDGTIDCIITDHAPHSKEDKADFMKAPNGVVGLETSLAVTLTELYHKDKCSLTDIVNWMAVNPRKLLGLNIHGIREGERADLILVDLDEEWTVEPEKLHSKSKNTVFKGEKLKGKVKAVFSDGILRFCEM